MDLQLKKIEKSDENLLLEWRNSPSIVALGALKKTVSQEEHSAWIERILSDLHSYYFLIIKDGIKCGQARLELVSPKNYQISIYLIEKFQGKKIGSFVLELLSRDVLHKNDVIIAKVIKENLISKNFFTKNGFYIDEFDGQKDDSLLTLFRKI